MGQVKYRLWIIALILLSTGCKPAEISILESATGQAAYQAVPASEVELLPGFWEGRMAVLRQKTLPHLFGQLESHGQLQNLALAAQQAETGFVGKRYNDSDVYKVIEAAAWCLMNEPEPALAAKVDTLISSIAAAQAPDGYIYTQIQIERPNKRFTNPSKSHELYNMGHLIEAGIAHFHATGKTNLLEIAKRAADMLVSRYLTATDMPIPGHPEFELALTNLYHLTGEQTYVQLANRMIRERGLDSTFDLSRRRYLSAHKPLIDQDSVVGHAVRALYLYTGATSLAISTQDTSLLDVLVVLWEDLVHHKLSLTGGVGQSKKGEAFGPAYVLDPTQAYNETCGAVALMHWSYLLFQATGEARFLDVFERTLYNGMLAGMSLAGESFFYVNPLGNDGKTPFNQEAGIERAAWFETACCPPNLARMIAALPNYLYAIRKDTLVLTTYVSSQANIHLPAGVVSLTQQTLYPWEGKLSVRINTAPPKPFTLSIRLPSWAQNQPVPSSLYRYQDRDNRKLVLSLNGDWIVPEVANGFMHIRRVWAAGDDIRLDIPMVSRRVVAHTSIKALQGFQAFERGPIVYAAEQQDQASSLDKLAIAPTGLIEVQSDTLEQVHINRLWVPTQSSPLTPKLSMVPYFSWANRGNLGMKVWWPAAPALLIH